MFLGIDGRFMRVPGGLGRYTRELITHLAGQSPQDHFTVLVLPETPNLPTMRNVEYIEVAIPWYGIAEQIKLGLIMNRMTRVETWFIPHWNVPLFLFQPFVFTIHDFIFEEFPTYSPGRWNKINFFIKWGIWRMLLGWNVQRTKGIITVSEFVKKGVIERFPWAASKTVAIYPGVSAPLPSNASTPAAPFFMMVGNSYPHKNQTLLFAAYAAHPEFTTETIIFTHQDRFSEQLAARNTDSRIKIVFDAPDEIICAHYAAAAALIFPSRAEGFGFPPLEALSYGTPAIVAHTSVMPEILKDNVTWVSPDDSEELFAAMKRILTLPKPGDAGKKFAATFQWKNAALSTRNFLQKVLY